MKINMSHLPINLFTLAWEPAWVDKPESLTIEKSIEDHWNDGRARAMTLARALA